MTDKINQNQVSKSPIKTDNVMLTPTGLKDSSANKLYSLNQKELIQNNIFRNELINKTQVTP